MEVTTRPLTRQQLGDLFQGNHRAIVAFETVQRDIGTQGDVFSTAPFVTTDANTNLGAARVLTGDDDVTVTDDPAAHTVTLGLTDTGIVNGAYGSATQTVQYTVDAKGRLIGGNSFTLITTNITEGTKLFYTDARARAAVSGSAGIIYVVGTGAFTLDQSFSRGLLSSGSGINYNAGTGVIATTGYTGDIVVGAQTLHFTDGILSSVT